MWGWPVKTYVETCGDLFTGPTSVRLKTIRRLCQRVQPWSPSATCQRVQPSSIGPILATVSKARWPQRGFVAELIGRPHKRVDRGTFVPELVVGMSFDLKS